MNPSITNTTFNGNTASYGPNLASYPVRIGMVNSSKHDPIILNDVGSGITLENDLKLALIDNEDQVMVLDSTNQLIILSKNSSDSSVGGTNAVKLKNGIATFDSLSASAKPGSSSVEFSVSSKVLDLSKVLQALNRTETSKDLVMNFRFCQPGEQVIGDQ